MSQILFAVMIHLRKLMFPFLNENVPIPATSDLENLRCWCECVSTRVFNFLGTIDIQKLFQYPLIVEAPNGQLAMPSLNRCMKFESLPIHLLLLDFFVLLQKLAQNWF